LETGDYSLKELPEIIFPLYTTKTSQVLTQNLDQQKSPEEPGLDVKNIF